MDARRRLREHIRNKKNQRGGTARDDCRMHSSKLQDALLNVAGDDADMLKLAQQALKDPSQLLKALSNSSASSDQNKAIKSVPDVEEEEEDLPESMKGVTSS